jgi:glyoxylase-like metal-dependent hydrolase (beta-lactamase superfamily II)
MKKVLKIILITIGVIVGVLVLAWGGLFLYLQSETKKFTPLETGHIVDNIFVLKDKYVLKDDFVNAFIIQDSTQYVVIDCANNPAIVAEQMEKLGINPDNVAAVFLTHTDRDHVGALSLFNKAKLYMSKEEEKMINGTKSKFLWFGNFLPRTDYILLDDREVVQIGNLKFEAFLVPGHTSGMTAYLVSDKYLFIGDIASLKNGKVAPFPALFDMDTKQAVKSREIIRHISTAEYIFTGHYGYTDDYQTAVKN